MAATLKILPVEPTLGETGRSWNLTDLLRRVAADDRPPPECETDPGLESASAAMPGKSPPALGEAVRWEPAAGEEPWADALDLAVEASDAIRFAEERIARLEAENRELEAYLEQEVRSLQARMKAADEVVQLTEAARSAAEARAERAEERADAAEKCLNRIRDQLSPIRRARTARPSGG